MDETRKTSETAGRANTRRATTEQDVPPINAPATSASTPSDRAASDAASSTASRSASLHGSQSTQSSVRTGSEGGNVSTGLMDRMKDRANAQLSTQKNRATDGIGSVAQAVRRSTQELRQQHHETVAEYVDRAADQLELMSTRLKNKDMSELMRDAQNLAKRQPAIFIGTAFMLGLVGARFMKSSPTDAYGDQSGWQRTGAYDSGATRLSGGTAGRGALPVTENM
jgi:hypothetical protein